jgi:hypothetical protein
MLALLLSVSVLAQTSVCPIGPNLNVRGDGIQNAPYSAQSRFTSVKHLPDGAVIRSESGGSQSRDSKGRTYTAGEREWTYSEGDKRVLKKEMLYRINNPVANTETRWDSSTKEAKVIQLPPSALTEDNSSQGSDDDCLVRMAALGAVVEKLGVKTINGAVAEGTRGSYTVRDGKSNRGQPRVVVHETWYCPELKIVVLETDDDPVDGKTSNELISIVRGEPDVTQYQPPAGYSIQLTQMP